MSTKINNSTLVYNGGSLKFEDTGSKFRNYVLPTGIQIKTLLDLDTISGVSSLDYKKPLDEYNLHNFFFFYNTYTEDGTLNIANLDKGDDAKTFLIYVSIAQGVDVRITSMTNYRGDVPILEPNTDYLILVTKESNGLVVEIIAKSVILNSCLKLVFNIKKENLTLDLSDTFPDVIYGFTPRYRGAVYFDVDESGEVVGDGYKLENKDLLTHTYDTPGLHTVTVKGICEGLGQVPSSCVRCEEASGIKYFGKLFCYCVNFTSFPDTIFQDIGGQSELNGCFQGTQITRIPENLFPRNRTIKRIVGLFSENVKLTDYGQEKSVIPENLFTPLENLEELVSVFDSCYYITKVPNNIFKSNKKLVNTFRCFNGTGIDNDPTIIGDEIPEGVIDGLNITNTEATFGMLGYGRMMRHVDNYENPHNVTLQQAYDKQVVINGNSVNIKDGLSFTGSPLNIVDAQTNSQAVTLKQLKDAQVNHVVVKGEWDVTGKSDYSSIPYKEVGYCYLIKGTTTTIEGQTWNEGDFLLITEGDTAGSLKYLKFENTNSWQEMVQLNYGNTANLTANTVRKEVYVGNDAVFRVSSFTSDQTLFKHPSGNGIVFTSGGNSISGNKPLTLASDPVNSMDAVTKQYMDENSGWAIKTWNNTSTNPDADKKETAWTGQNVFTGGGRIGMFYFNPDSTNQELKSYVESKFTVSHNRHVASLGKGNIDNYSGAYLELVYQKQGTYGLSDVNSIIQIVNNSGSGYRNQFVENSGNKFFEELRLSSSEKIKEFSGNITVITDKTVFNNDNEFITKKYVDENSGTAIKSWDNIDSTSSATGKTSAWTGQNKFTNTTEFSADVSVTGASVTTDKVGIDNFADNELITKNAFQESLEKWIGNTFEVTTTNREVYFDGLKNNGNAHGCRYITKNNGISGTFKINKIKFFSGDNNVGGFTGSENPIMIGLYTMNATDEVIDGTTIKKWTYPKSLVAYSTNSNVFNTIGSEMVFDSFRLAPKKRLEGIIQKSSYTSFVYPEEYESVNFNPEGTPDTDVYWDFSEPMLIVFFWFERDESGEITFTRTVNGTPESITIKRGIGDENIVPPPISGEHIVSVANSEETPRSSSRVKQLFSYNPYPRFLAGSSNSAYDEVASKYVSSPGFNPSRKYNPSYIDNMNLLRMHISILGTSDLFIYGINTSGNMITGTNNVWTGKNDFYASTLVYKKATTDTEVVNVEFIKDYIHPIGSVLTTTSNSSPTLFNTSWTQIGSQSIGSTTVYYWQRTS